MCAWVEPQTSAGGQPIFVGGPTAGDVDLFGIGASGNPCSSTANSLLFLDHWNGGACRSSASVAVPAGQWSFVCLAYDGASTVTLYSSGVSATASQTLYDYDLDTVTIGSNNFPIPTSTSLGPSFDGAIANVGIWTVALTVSQMNELYDNGKGCVP